jgi:hypothetical protein
MNKILLEDIIIYHYSKKNLKKGCFVMKQSKKVIAAVVSLALTCGSLSTGLIASAANYPDTENHWAEEQIDLWSSRNVLSGYEDGSFRPDDTISRGEIVTVLTKLIALTDKGNKSFTDVDGSEWYADAVLAAGNAGIINGDTEGNANATNAATREEAATLFARSFQVADDQSAASVYSDSSDISAWANGYVGGRNNSRLHDRLKRRIQTS